MRLRRLSGFHNLVDITDTGFSIAIKGIGAAINKNTNSRASSVSCGSLKPLLVLCAYGDYACH